MTRPDRSPAPPRRARRTAEALDDRQRAVYQRQMMLPGFDEARQLRLAGSAALVARAGARAARWRCIWRPPASGG